MFRILLIVVVVLMEAVFCCWCVTLYVLTPQIALFDIEPLIAAQRPMFVIPVDVHKC